VFFKYVTDLKNEQNPAYNSPKVRLLFLFSSVSLFKGGIIKTSFYHGDGVIFIILKRRIVLCFPLQHVF
jgi:hypothetical protein